MSRPAPGYSGLDRGLLAPDLGLRAARSLFIRTVGGLLVRFVQAAPTSRNGRFS